MELTHHLLKIEQSLNGFTSGSYNAPNLYLEPYGGSGTATLPEYMAKMAKECSEEGNSTPVPIVKELKKRVDQLDRDVQFYQNTLVGTRPRTYPVFTFTPFGPQQPKMNDQDIVISLGVLAVGGGLVLGVAVVPVGAGATAAGAVGAGGAGGGAAATPEVMTTILTGLRALGGAL